MSLQKYSFLLLIVFIFAGTVTAQTKEQKADTLADKPKIKQYWLVMIKTGPRDKEVTDTAERKRIFAGHMNNIERLYRDGILKVAGPFGKNDYTWRGIFIFDCATKDDVLKYVQSDPAIAAGIFIVEIAPWYTMPTKSFSPGKPAPND